MTIWLWGSLEDFLNTNFDLDFVENKCFNLKIKETNILLPKIYSDPHLKIQQKCKL